MKFVPRRPAPLPTAPVVATIRLDPVAVISGFAAEMNQHAERAAQAARDGRVRDALLAAGAMQMLLKQKEEVLREALAAARSKRGALELRRAVRQAALAALPPVERSVRAIGMQARARRARQAAIGEALRRSATAPARAYTAKGYGGAAQPVRRALAVTV